MMRTDEHMKIAIIGTGNVGHALAFALRDTAHQVALGARNPDSAMARQLAADSGARLLTPDDAAAAADVVVLALPWAVAEEALAALGPLDGKVVIDCMNPLGMVDGVLDLTLGHAVSGAEMVQRWLPGAHVVKALNQVGAEVLGNARAMARRPVMFVAADAPDAKAATLSLMSDLGFEGRDAGPLRRARLLEPYALIWIDQAMLRGAGRNWALAVEPLELPR